MSLRSRGAALMNRLQPAAGAIEIFYRRKAGGLYTIVDAVVGRSQVETQQVGAKPIRTDHRERVYLIPAASLTDGVSPFEPATGDEITETIDGLKLVFECKPADGRPPWDYADSGQTRVRINCKRVS